MTMNSMEYSSLLSVALFAVFIPAIVARSSSSIDQTMDLIEETCLKTIYPDFCTVTLRQDSRSATAKGPVDLGIIMLDQADLNAQSTITRITPLINQVSDPKVKEALSSCNEGYISTVSEWVPLSKDSFTKNEPRLAFQYMSNATVAALHCEKELKGLGWSRFSGWNKVAEMAATVCATIANSLL